MSDFIDSFCPWDGWEFVRLLGRGTYGRVSLFKRDEYENVYFSAIKHISIPTDPNQINDAFAEGIATDEITLKLYCTDLLKSFMNEININVELRGHSNFVSYDDHKIIPREDSPGYDIFIKMEYLTNLNEYLQKFPFTLEDTIRLAEDICTALSVLQKRNLIHRDIKPENIFVNRDGNFKLGDFGIVRSLDQSVTRMSTRGTLMFMAPELARHEKSDYRIDLYSLGLVLYRLLNGNRAPFLPAPPKNVTHFEHSTAQDMRMRGETLPPPARADEGLSSIILKACAFEMDQRWRNAVKMKDAITEYANSLSNQAKKTTVLDITIPKELKEPDASDLTYEATLLLGSQNDSEVDIDEKPPPISTQQKKRSHMFVAIAASCVIVIGLIALSLFVFFPQLLFPPQQIEDPGGQVILPVSEPPLSQDPVSPTSLKPSLPTPFAFSDAAIEEAIRILLNKRTGDVFPVELDSITELRVEFGFVESLEDLTALSNLKILGLRDQPVHDAAVLGELTGLEVLNLSGCQLPDIAFIDSLSKLIRLDISRNDLFDIQCISKLEHIVYLNISDNSITDLSPLIDLSELQTLDAKNNPVEDWSIVQHIPVVYGVPEEVPEPEPPVTPPSPPPSPPSSPRPTQSPPPSPSPSEPATPSVSPPPSIPVSGVSISQSSVLMELSGKISLSANVSPIDATNQTLLWTSSNSSIATVDRNGNVSAVGRGTAYITVSCGDYRSSCVITVS